MEYQFRSSGTGIPFKHNLHPRRTDLQNLMMKVTGIYQMPDWKDAMRDYIQELRG